ncbi:GspE/PulE family protein [Methylovorus glucosotrophus]|uniref:Type II secretion system protein E n=1 Tax=Methylovorus glucosotrophus (strain SIP3-4) TaxID=582744 RepID=C6XET2_METGS|nr:ATPase, T2SS/T4P/T4SS family [Methylovorus glucosotrophus]ACT52139.1 type II secretion system protein E [Methylovorus glucosotrophus SIP3-4]
MNYNGHKVLTAEGGEYDLPEELRHVMAFLDDGRLLVSKSHTFNPHVNAFVGKLERAGKHFQFVTVEMAVIAEVYKGAQAETKQAAHSDMQKVAFSLFEKAVKLRASDIHIRVSGRDRTKILFRVHDDLELVGEDTYENGLQLCTTIYHSMSSESDAVFLPQERQDARISDKDKLPKGLDGIRIATTPQVDGNVMVLRLLYNDTTENLDLTSLGYEKHQAEDVDVLKKKPTGIIVIGGPTGSGKSTTLQRVLASIIKESMGRKNVITVEDPPEYPITGAVQTPVTNADGDEARSDAFQKAIRAAMRLDPDVMMIGEVRDSPSARLAIQGAMTGHQVYTTVHANSAFAILNRLIDLGVQMELLSDPSIVSGLICQRLLKVLCDHCKLPLDSAEVQKRYKESDIDRIMRIGRLDQIFVHGHGCDHCRNTGLTGRTVVAETVATNEELMSFIRNNDRLGALEHWKRNMNGMTMLDHAVKKVLSGTVDPFQAEDIVGFLGTS